jgi:DNA-binding MarR family transcriptional regulator/GNAT superfamily N-acetyltransferase
VPAAALSTSADPPHVAAVRAFNRFYTRRVGALQEHLLGAGFTLPQSRLLWELAQQDGSTAAQLARTLELDPGYLSRLLRTLKERKLLRMQRSPADGRQTLLSLSAAGRRAFAPLDQRARAQTREWLAPLPAPAQERLLGAMGTVQQLLGNAEPAPVVLRPHRAGDIGWVIERHGALYAQEYGWDLRFEALVARIAADFIDRFDARREACWIAERAGERLGCVCLVQARDDASGAALPGTAQLRLLLVEPQARGLGLGKQLTAACERFAREAGYTRICLWTQRSLRTARGIYSAAGYRLVGSEKHTSFGKRLVGERWELELSPGWKRSPALAAPPPRTRPAAAAGMAARCTCRHPRPRP